MLCTGRAFVLCTGKALLLCTGRAFLLYTGAFPDRSIASEQWQDCHFLIAKHMKPAQVCCSCRRVEVLCETSTSGARHWKVLW